MARDQSNGLCLGRELIAESVASFSLRAWRPPPMFQMVPSSWASQELLDDVIAFIIIDIKPQMQPFDLLWPIITSLFILCPSITRVQRSSEFSEATLLRGKTNRELATIVGREDREVPRDERFP